MTGEKDHLPRRKNVYPQGDSLPLSIPPSVDRHSVRGSKQGVPSEGSTTGTNVPPPSFQPARRPVRKQQAAPGRTRNEPRPIAYTPVERPYAEQQPPKHPHERSSRKRRRRGRKFIALTLIIAMLLVWPVWLLWDTNRNLHRIDAIQGGVNTPGTTYLIAGSDSRDDGTVDDDTEGERSDSIILMHVAPNGQTSMVSLPRDTYVEIPDYGYNKLNAAFSFGGPPLLVKTVQNLTGLTIDHYAQVNMGGFINLVNAVDGVHACLDYDVDEPHSGLKWTAGCKDINGDEALSFARMRYQDPRGDLGRAERQRQIIGEVTRKALSPKTLLDPRRQLALSRAGVDTIYVDESMSIFDLAKLLWTFKNASKSGLSGTPPIASLGEPTDAGLALFLDEDRAPLFFQKLAEGQLSANDFETEL